MKVHSMNSEPDISIIICTYNRSGYLIDTLESLIKNSAEPSVYEIIVVDNNSKDNTEEIVRNYADARPSHTIRYIKEINQGISFARNRGIRETRAPLLAFIDDDELAGDNWITEWLQFFRNHPNAVGGGGKIKVQFDDPRPRWMPEILLTIFGKHNLGNKIKKYDLGRYPFAGNSAYRLEIFEKTGLFNTSLGRKGELLEGGEEKELFYRIIRYNDAVIYVPDAYIWHRVGAARLTKVYIKGQAKGIGKSIAVMLDGKHIGSKFTKWILELAKLGVSIVMCAGYFLILRPTKGVTLLQFRFWVWSGYFGHRKELDS